MSALMRNSRRPIWLLLPLLLVSSHFTDAASWNTTSFAGKDNEILNSTLSQRDKALVPSPFAEFTPIPLALNFQNGNLTIDQDVVPRPDQVSAVQMIRPLSASTLGQITFDDYPVNTIIGSQYAGKGVTFDRTFIELDNLPSIRYLSADNESYPSPYGNGLNAAPITATFAVSTPFVEAVPVYLDQGSVMIIKAYNNAGALIGTISGASTLRLTAAGIKKAVFSFVGSQGRIDDIAGIDNLRFEASSVVFKEHGINYGWDDFTDPKVPAKSVRTGYNDTVLAIIDPPTSYPQQGFTSSNSSTATVTPSVATQASQVLSIAGKTKGSATIRATDRNTSIVLATLNAGVYSVLNKTVAVTLVHKKSTGAGDPGYKSHDIPTADITAMLNTVFKQGVLHWTIVRQPDKTVAFDLNKDNKIDVNSWMSAEMQIVRDACKSARDYDIFIVDNPSDGSTGFMQYNQKYGFIHQNAGANARTVAHELGHGVAGLVHTPNDIMNIMYNYASTTKWRLRKSQWDKLNP
jgi:hypothetical protein